MFVRGLRSGVGRARFTNFHIGAVDQPQRAGVVFSSRLGFYSMKDDMKYRTLIASLLVAFGAAGAYAQTTTANTVQRDVNQQTRIEAGLKDGSLSTKEAGRLEREESQVDRLQAKDLKDGKLTPRERAQLRRAQNRASQDIHNAKTNDVKGNPESASSERMQADVARNVTQEKRVEQGVQSGALTNREAGQLERGQARVERQEAMAGRDGHVGKLEQSRVQRKENQQSEEIFDKKHNGKNRKG
jgi:predicted transglutaminase-like cysteine proteinase